MLTRFSAIAQVGLELEILQPHLSQYWDEEPNLLMKLTFQIHLPCSATQ
jgi:hypothetical protein